MISILTGDALTVLRQMEPDSLHCCVTSPPYFGLRDYGVDGQIGSEDTPERFIQALVEVFYEVRRVLRPEATCWVNLGDSYAGSRCGPQGSSGYAADRTDSKVREIRGKDGKHKTRAGAANKNLLMMPARLALALQADGWWLRSDIIWHKGNPMPESVFDRPTSAHEHVFLLAKSESYFYDAEAIKEETTGTAHARGTGVHKKANDGVGIKQNSSFSAAVTETVPFRNSRNVWTINSAPFKGAHFATFPPELARRCIAAGTSECGACARCGAPFRRILGDKIPVKARGAGNGFKRPERTSYQDANGARGDDAVWVPTVRPTIRWDPTCGCPDPYPEPCVVLDPFMGAGTTGLVAQRLGRDAVGIELNPESVQIATDRINGEFPGVMRC